MCDCMFLHGGYMFLQLPAGRLFVSYGRRSRHQGVTILPSCRGSNVSIHPTEPVFCHVMPEFGKTELCGQKRACRKSAKKRVDVGRSYCRRQRTALQLDSTSVSLPSWKENKRADGAPASSTRNTPSGRSTGGIVGV